MNMKPLLNQLVQAWPSAETYLDGLLLFRSCVFLASQIIVSKYATVCSFECKISKQPTVGGAALELYTFTKEGLPVPQAL